MKRIMTLVAVFLMVAASQAQTLQSLFDKYREDEHFEYVSVGKGMMNTGRFFGRHRENNNIKPKMRSTKILTLKTDAGSELMKSFEKELDQVVEKGNFETVVETRNKGERTNIYYRLSGKDNADMLIVTKEKGEFSLIWFNGNMTKEEMMHTFSDAGEIINSSGFNEKVDGIASK